MSVTDIVFRNASGVPVTTSYLVAETFGKQHKNVLRDIDNLDCSDNLRQLNFELSFRIKELPNGGRKEERFYYIGKDGFTLMAMGYTGKKAMEFKEKYIHAFNSMQTALSQAPQLTAEFMQTQQQMMQQVINLCSAVMRRLEGEVSIKPSAECVSQPTPVEPTDEPKRILKQYKSNGSPVSLNGDAWNKCIVSYNELRIFYPDYIKTCDVARELRRRGIPVYQNGLFRYLREKGYLSDGHLTFNRPAKVYAENRQMVAVLSGGGRIGYKHRYIPYYNPGFIDELESGLRYMRRSVKNPYFATVGEDEA